MSEVETSRGSVAGERQRKVGVSESIIRNMTVKECAWPKRREKDV